MEHTEGRCYFGYCRCIKVEEVKDAIRRMSKGKVSGPDDIPVEFRKSIGKLFDVGFIVLQL